MPEPAALDALISSYGPAAALVVYYTIRDRQREAKLSARLETVTDKFINTFTSLISASTAATAQVAAELAQFNLQTSECPGRLSPLPPLIPPTQLQRSPTP